MAEFQQSAAAGQALQRAAMGYLAQTLGVSMREVQRWRAFLSGQAQQQRNPARAFQRLEPVQLEIKGTYTVSKDERDRTLTAEVGEDFFLAVLQDPDEGWEVFLDSNNYPHGTMDDVSLIRFS